MMEGNGNHPDSIDLKQHHRNIAVEVILVLLTCGFYDLFWQYRQIEFINHMAGEEKLFFWRWLGLTFITCGLYNLYHEHKMAREINFIQEKYNVPITNDLPIASLLLSLVSFGIIADAIQQYEINNIIDRLRPSDAPTS